MEDAIAFLEKDGAWCRGSMWKDAEGHITSPWNAVSACAQGALRIAARIGDKSVDTGQFVRIRMALAQRMGVAEGNKTWVGGYNDDPAHTKEDVLLMMKRTLEDLNG